MPLRAFRLCVPKENANSLRTESIEKSKKNLSHIKRNSGRFRTLVTLVSLDQSTLTMGVVIVFLLPK